jgi:hypothetical protein
MITHAGLTTRCPVIAACKSLLLADLVKKKRFGCWISHPSTYLKPRLRANGCMVAISMITLPTYRNAVDCFPRRSLNHVRISCMNPIVVRRDVITKDDNQLALDLHPLL